MPIHEVTDTEVSQSCAGCGSKTKIALDRLEVGIAQGELIDDRIIPLPPCPTCKAAEFLIQSTGEDVTPATADFGYLHRLLVDHVHAVLVGRNRLVKQLLGPAKQGGVSARPVDPATLQRWFPAGLRIDPKDLNVAGPSSGRKEDGDG